MLQKTVFIGFVKLKYGRGRVYEIVDYGQLLAGLPAPTKFNIIQVRISPKMI